MSSQSISGSSSPSQFEHDPSIFASHHEVKGYFREIRKTATPVNLLYIKLIKELHDYFNYKHQSKDEFEVQLCKGITSCLRNKLSHKKISFPKDPQVRKIFDLAINTATSQTVEKWINKARQRRLVLQQEFNEAPIYGADDVNLQNRLDVIRSQHEKNEQKMAFMKRFREPLCVFTFPLGLDTPKAHVPQRNNSEPF